MGRRKLYSELGGEAINIHGIYCDNFRPEAGVDSPYTKAGITLKFDLKILSQSFVVNPGYEKKKQAGMEKVIHLTDMQYILENRNW